MPVDIKTEFKFDEEKIAAKLKTIEENVNAQQGKRLHNPFIWLSKSVNPLIRRLNVYIVHPTDEELANGKVSKEFPPERTKELYDKLMALPDVPPLPKMSVDNNSTETNINNDKPI